MFFLCTVIHPPHSVITLWMSLSGWFQDLPGQKECYPCPPGFQCQSLSPSPLRGSSTGVSTPLSCPAGYFCPRDSPPLPCPKGTFSPNLGLTTIGNNPEAVWKLLLIFCAIDWFCVWKGILYCVLCVHYAVVISIWNNFLYFTLIHQCAPVSEMLLCFKPGILPVLL